MQLQILDCRDYVILMKSPFFNVSHGVGNLLGSSLTCCVILTRSSCRPSHLDAVRAHLLLPAAQPHRQGQQHGERGQGAQGRTENFFGSFPKNCLITLRTEVLYVPRSRVRGSGYFLKVILRCFS